MTRRRVSDARRSPAPLGTVEQLPSGRWRAFYRREGRKFTAPHTFASRAEGDTWLASEFADRARGTWRDPEAGRVPLSAYAADWLATADVSPKTRSLYAHMIGKWISPRIGDGPNSRGIELGSMHVGDLTPATVRTWYATALATAHADAVARAAADTAQRRDPVRAWAKAHGIPVADTGRISPTVIAEWERAGSPIPAKPRAEVSANAGRGTVTNAYRVLRTVLNLAVTDGLLDRNPCQIKGAGESRTTERGTATPAEVTALAAHMPRRFRAAVLLAAWSGLRAGEEFALARRHIDLDAGTVFVERSLLDAHAGAAQFGTPKTLKSRRHVTLPGFVLDELRAHMAEFTAPSPDALVFTLENGSPVTSPRRSAMFGKARRIIGRDDLTWHDLRHTGATLAYRAGASVPEVQRRLGHTTMRAAQVYAHAADDSDQIIAQRLDALYAEASRATHLHAL